MSVFNKTTIDHGVIRAWAERFDAVPQLIDDPESQSDTVGLRLDFPGRRDDPLFDKSKYKNISWEDFFILFDDMHLGFVYDDLEKLQDPSVCYRFADRERMKQQYVESEE